MTRPAITIADGPIRRELDALRARIRIRFLIHGTLWLIAVVSGILLAHFALDRLLNLPAGVRVVVLVAIAAYLVAGFRRRLLYPLRRSLQIDDIALLIERNHPELHQELISAVQLARDQQAGQLSDSPALAAEVVRTAAEHLSRIDTGTVLRGDRTARVLGAAAVLAVAFLSVPLFTPASFRVWCSRLLGFAVDYPRDTFLRISVPAEQGNYRLREPGDSLAAKVDLARGADLPVHVDVQGKVPEIVELHVEPIDGGPVATFLMTRRGSHRFRYLFRRALRAFRVHATGGDDPGTLPIEVRILTPPVVTGLSVIVTPPAYAGLEPKTSQGGLIEALPGSHVEVRLKSSEALTKGFLRFQDSSNELALERFEPEPGKTGTPKAREATTAPGDAKSDGTRTGVHYRASFTMPGEADRYRIALFAQNGLREQSPGLYSVVPLEDRKPRVCVFSPGPSLTAMITKAAVPLRLLATDDYGLSEISIEAQLGEKGKSRRLALWNVTDAEPAGDASKPVKKHGLLRFVRSADLLPEGERKPREGDRLRFSIWATDNRVLASGKPTTPADGTTAQKGTVQTVRIDLLEIDELRRRLQDRLRSTRRVVETARKLQVEQSTRLGNYLVDLGEGQPSTSLSPRFDALESGQTRVRSLLRRVRTDLMETIDAHLFNGLDTSQAVADVIALYQRYFTEHSDAPASDPDFYRAMNTARKAGTIGNLDLLARLGDMFRIADSLHEETINACLGFLAQASIADNDKDLRSNLAKTQLSQAAVVKALDELLRLLENWNNYQDLVRNARRLERQQSDVIKETTGDGSTGTTRPGKDGAKDKKDARREK